MNTDAIRTKLPWLLLTLSIGALGATRTSDQQAQPRDGAQPTESTDENTEEAAMNIHYLEIVTPDVDATCKSLEQIHGVQFSDPDAALGNARTAPLQGGGHIGVRAPLRADEQPVVRPYILVDDLEAAVEKAKAGGGEMAIESMELPGHGTIAIYVQGGIDHGLWQR